MKSGRENKRYRIKKIILKAITLVAGAYILLCVLIYFFQEKLIFFPDKLEKKFQFTFNSTFEELTIKLEDGETLSGILFKADSSKGLIFYLHGNGGSLIHWGEVADIYIQLKYDVFIPDYRGYGKSGGFISSEKQFYSDMQTAYEEMKKKYPEEKIIISGYSIGTGAAAMLASTNNPGKLILQAPYYNLTDVMHTKFPLIPAFLLKYKFKTNEYLEKCNMPVTIFHGNKDQIIYYGSSLKLKKLFKPTDTLITLEGHGHAIIATDQIYLQELRKILG